MRLISPSSRSENGARACSPPARADPPHRTTRESHAERAFVATKTAHRTGDRSGPHDVARRVRGVRITRPVIPPRRVRDRRLDRDRDPPDNPGAILDPARSVTGDTEWAGLDPWPLIRDHLAPSSEADLEAGSFEPRSREFDGWPLRCDVVLIQPCGEWCGECDAIGTVGVMEDVDSVDELLERHVVARRPVLPGVEGVDCLLSVSDGGLVVVE